MSEANTNTKLAEALGIAPPTNTAVAIASPSQEPPIASNNQIQDDADYARQEIYDLVTKGAEAIDQIMEVARESQHPRAYEVLAGMLKTQSDNIDKLLKLQKEKKELLKNEDAQSSSGGMNIDRAVIFNGTSDDLIRAIRRDNRDPHNIIDIDSSEE